MQILLTPVLAFLIYLALSASLSVLGRKLAGPVKPSLMKSSTYSSGERPPTVVAVPGYRPFFVLALQRRGAWVCPFMGGLVFYAN